VTFEYCHASCREAGRHTRRTSLCVAMPPQWNPPAYCQQWDTRTSDPGPHGHIAMSVRCGHLATGTRDGEPACDRHRTPGTTEKDIAP